MTAMAAAGRGDLICYPDAEALARGAASWLLTHVLAAVSAGRRQPAVCLAEIMVGHARKQVVKRMIAQAHGSPQRRKRRRRRDVDAVEELGGDAYRLALILPQMRDECTNLVEQHHS